MAAIMRLATATSNALAQIFQVLLDGGTGAGVIELYTAPMPASANTAISTQTLLGAVPFNDPSAPEAAAGVLTFDVDPVLEDAQADDTGDVAWARIKDSDGNTICDVNVGTADAVIIMNTVSLVAGGPIRINSFTITMPSGE